ncbi:GAF and ANTAR domain-containing protein [Nocardia crassostreae]|uniref:GAF and ANTAR domain-containing protein n=1 Tax=Nocardia crassostreae TaxID=53428 RepID=UPI000833388C|nr:GAF and ANTAR domain-containing protein [Nocardia crassostreae]
MRQVVPDSFAIALAELTAAVLSTGDIGESRRAITDFATRAIPGHPLARVTLAGAAGVCTTTAPEPPFGELPGDAPCGPCSEALRNDRIVIVPDLGSERRWGEYPAGMLRLGYRSVHSRPLAGEGGPIGALTLYSRRSHAFAPPIHPMIDLIGTHAGALLASVLAAARRSAATTRLMADLTARSAIDQALGILAAQRRCSIEDARATLSHAARLRGIATSDAAAELIRAVTGSEPAPVHFELQAHPGAAVRPHSHDSHGRPRRPRDSRSGRPAPRPETPDRPECD